MSFELRQENERLGTKVAQLKKALLALKRNSAPVPGPPCWCPSWQYPLVHGHCEVCRQCKAAVE